MEKNINKLEVRTYEEVILDKELINSFDKVWNRIDFTNKEYRKKGWIEHALKCQNYNRENIIKTLKQIISVIA